MDERVRLQGLANQPRAFPTSVTCADRLIEYLAALGIEYAFGIPGGALEPFMDALARGEQREMGPKCVIARHETGAAFMAAAYAKATGKMAVCFATTGPGITNMVTGIASAHAENIPMLVISAQTSLHTFGRGAFQESSCTGTNSLAILDSITRYNSLVSHPDQLEHKLTAAIMTAHEASKGPVHLSIPFDVMRAGCRQPASYPNFGALLQQRRLLDTEGLERFYQLLNAARHPVIVLGEDAAPAIDDILELASSFDLPVIETPNGKGLVSAFHPLYCGVIGFAGHDTARAALSNPRVDLVTVIGSKLNEWNSNGWDSDCLLNEKLVHIESNPESLTNSPMAKLHISGDMALFFQKLNAKLKLSNVRDLAQAYPEGMASTTPPVSLQRQFSHQDETGIQSNQSPILPQRLMTLLPELLPPGTRYLTDTGNSFAWGIHYLHPRKSGGRSSKANSTRLFDASLTFSSMGWALSSAVGTALATPGDPVVCITGDGSYLMAGQEMTVANELGLSVIFIILNDGALGMVRHGQLQTGAENIGFDLPAVNFAAMAQAVGVRGIVIQSPQDLLDLDFENLLQARAPCLLDVRVDPDAKPPISLRTKTLRDER